MGNRSFTEGGSDHFDITPSNTVNFTAGTVRAIHVGVGGTVAVVHGQTGVVANYTAAAGSYLNVYASRVNVTGTTATNMVGLL